VQTLLAQVMQACCKQLDYIAQMLVLAVSVYPGLHERHVFTEQLEQVEEQQDSWEQLLQV